MIYAQQTSTYQNISKILIHPSVYIYIYIYIYTGLDKIMETPGIFKFILIWFSDCCSSVKSGFVQLSSNSFWINKVFKIVIKLCCNFRSCIQVILPKNQRKSSTVHIRQLLLSSRVLLQWGDFPSFSNAVITFQTVVLATPNTSAVVVTLARLPYQHQQFRPLLKSDRSAILMNFINFFWWNL